MGQPIHIAGPTGCGKSAVALTLGRRLNGEIVSVDSMQVYRGLDIGTAKPAAAERAAVRHHLIDVVELDEAFAAARFVAEVEKVVRGIEQAIFCGGTGLYFRAWLEGLGEAPAGSETVRAQLAEKTIEELCAELKEADPETFGKIDRQNRRRLVRAVEVIRLTGRSFAEQRAEWTGRVPANFFVLERTQEDLRERIDQRVEAMFAAGLVEETRALMPALQANPVAAQALGYRQVMELLAGERDEPETEALVKAQTRKFARRQRTWFGKLDGTISLPVASKEEPEDTAQRIIDQLK